MTRPTENRVIRAILAAVLGMVLAGPVAASEEQSVEAFTAWQADGKIFPMGPDRAVFQGDLGGVVYVRTEKGPIRAGTIICPGTAKISLVDAAQTGQGQCVFTANDGAQAFGEFTCEGRHLIGCKGDFTLTGGTGRLEGVTGGGPMLIRSELGTLAADATGKAIKRKATGILFWPELRFTVPK